jgi:DNA-binding MarR family transcriptional regulator
LGYDSCRFVIDGSTRVKKDSPPGTIYLLKRVELAIRGCAETALAPFGLTPTQFLILFRLKYSEGTSSAELARATGVRPQSIVDIIRPLERDGLIKRREAPEHRRILRITLSPAGEQLLARSIPVAAELERELLSTLSGQELKRLRESLTKLLASAEAHETHPGVRRAAAVTAMRAEIARPWKKATAPRQRRRSSVA